LKVAILAGGLGTRLSEETTIRPKPMVEIGGKPIIWHVMMHYSSFGFREFVIALGYKGEQVKDWMLEHSGLSKKLGDQALSVKFVQPDGKTGTRKIWSVDLVDTGPETLTGGRIKRLEPWLGNETFMLTWCDAVSDVDLNALLEFHRLHGRLATVTAVRPPPRFGHLILNGSKVTQFKEKTPDSEGWINGAYFVLEPKIFDYIEGDRTQWEKEPMEELAKEGQLMAYRHNGFWQCMDTIREKAVLEELWRSGRAKWKTWEE
jgi:glucose-1-phosphate cytidylyltransferase